MNIFSSMQQALVATTGGISDIGLLIVGLVILAIGIIMNFLVPSKYWIILVAIGIIVAIIGVLYLIFGPLI